MSSTVLLVDSEEEVRGIIEQQLGSEKWTITRVEDVGKAREEAARHEPALIVLNVDIAQGWPLCMDLKRKHTSVPLIVVSHRFGKEVFNNHQKLDTRADAYHRLPEEREGLEISLGYFSSHKSETGEDVHQVSGVLSRPRPRRTTHTPVPSGVLQRLEATVAEQARALEDARQQIEALEVERDAVAEKNRRQMLELMTVTPSSASGGEGSGVLKKRITELETEVLLISRREEELDDLRDKLATGTKDFKRLEKERTQAEAELARAREQLDKATRDAEQTKHALEARVATLEAERTQLTKRVADLEDLNRRTLREAGAQINESLEAAREAARKEANEIGDKLAQAEAQVTVLKQDAERLKEARAKVEGERDELKDKLAEAEKQAEAAQTAWSGVNTRLEQTQGALELKAKELEQLAAERKNTDEALATSRRLMREYATDAARKSEELKTLAERVKELESAKAGFDAKVDELTQALDFEKSLVASLEGDLEAARKLAAVASEEEIEALKAKAAEELEAAKTQAAEDLEILQTMASEELAEVRTKAAEDLEAATTKAAEELEAVKSQASADLEVALQANAKLEGDKAELELSNKALGARVAELTDGQETLNETLAAGGDAMATYTAQVHTRFLDLVGYARNLQTRLESAEMARSKIEVKLEQLASEVRSHALTVEDAPTMELPETPAE